MNYLDQFLLPVLAAFTILYLLYYFKYFKINSTIKDNINNSHTITNDYYSQNEIKSSTNNYISLYLSNDLPDYTKYSKRSFFSNFKRKNTKFEGIEYFTELFKEGYSENKYFLILGSAGIGKTTFLINLYSHCNQQIDGLNLQIIPLRSITIEEKIQKINTPNNTILILDGFDESPNSSNDDLVKLLNLTKDFKYVLISARLEFFSDIVNMQFQSTIKKYSGNKENYCIKKLYISPFSKKDVNQYLKNIFRVEHKYDLIKVYLKFIYRFLGNPDIVNANRILNKVKFASLRPLFLYYISDIIKDDDFSFNYDFEIYDELVRKWILRESYDLDNKIEFKKYFIQVLNEVAFKITNSDKSILSSEEVESITSIDNSKIHIIASKAKSLFIRNKENQYYFFHYSILDYFSAKRSFHEIKSLIPYNFWIDQEGTLFHHLRNEMLLKHIFNENFIVEGRISYREDGKFSLRTSDISSYKEALEVKYLEIITNKTGINFLALFPNLRGLRYPNMKESELKMIKQLNNLSLLDISNNTIITNLAEINNISSLKTLKIDNSVSNLATLSPQNNLETIIISKNQFSKNIISLFPEGKIKTISIFESQINKLYS
ncbi:hypothetical protein GCQ56_00380 [Marinifilum sp. N1E240]|uniref:NACHT domain-containing protein n=1 Tax=Marinifilum sp. N1E240 TaxID=2608082 RepID=UPI00128BFC32|nr:hypothetical protein [Marinifilum sp. N1E240]MPQ45452.1 hypothetical protein [Marinifilum sp. N1E240]